MPKASVTIDETEAGLSKQEQKCVDSLVTSFEDMRPALRVASFEALLATFCHECGADQPEDPEEECACVEASEGGDEDIDEDDDDESDDEDDEEEDEDETN
jgi:hypothetical protein